MIIILGMSFMGSLIINIKKCFSHKIYTKHKQNPVSFNIIKNT